MRIQTFSIIAGGTTCNARCAFCVSKMTNANGVLPKAVTPPLRLFKKAARFAQINGVSTAMITSKGEATLFPENVTWFLKHLEPYDFPIIELQTNGSKILSLAEKPASPAHGGKAGQSQLQQWVDLGLTTVAISVVHWLPERNKEVYFPSHSDYFDLPATIAKLHELGLRARLAVVMVKGYIDSAEAVDQMISFAREHKVEQLTFRPVNCPDSSADPDVLQWTKEHLIGDLVEQNVNRYIHGRGRHLLELMHGGCVYDVDGQNVCTTHSLTHSTGGHELRQIIFFPDGTLRYDWISPGALIF